MLALGTWQSVYVAIADNLYGMDTPESLRKAVELEPGNAAYHALLAEHLESAGEDPKPQLRAAVQLNPLDSLNLMRAAVRAETEQDYAAAEQYLKRAAAVDNKFVPRWALVNYYFRRGNEADFWAWTGRALEMSSPGDFTGIFRLAWEQSANPAVIFAHIPQQNKILQQYLLFLIQTQRIDAAVAVARRCAQLADQTDVPLLLDFCERALKPHSEAAVDIWNELSARKLIPFARLDPARGIIVTNKDFIVSAAPRAFDWQIPAVEGVFVSQADDGHGISVHLSGSEPEDCTILMQQVPLVPGKQYRFGYEYSSSGQSGAGLQWELTSENGILAASSDAAPDTEWKPGSVTFTANQTSGTLVLRYHRPAGSVRAEGTILFRRLQDQLVK